MRANKSQPVTRRLGITAATLALVATGVPAAQAVKLSGGRTVKTVATLAEAR